MATDLANVATAALIRELEELHEGVKQLVTPLEAAQLWARPVNPGNSIGHLILHLTGNLNHFVGAHLGGTEYRRDREREFNEANPPSRAVLLASLADAVALFRRVVSGLDAERLVAPHPESRFGPVLQALIHLVAHFALHRGQMSYLARIVQAGT